MGSLLCPGMAEATLLQWVMRSLALGNDAHLLQGWRVVLTLPLRTGQKLTCSLQDESEFTREWRKQRPTVLVQSIKLAQMQIVQQLCKWDAESKGQALRVGSEWGQVLGVLQTFLRSLGILWETEDSDVFSAGADVMENTCKAVSGGQAHSRCSIPACETNQFALDAFLSFQFRLFINTKN